MLTADIGTRLSDVKQEGFCLLVATGEGKKASAIMAGYSPGAAACTAWKLLRRPEVQARIAELRKNMETVLVMDTIERKIKLSEIARGDLTDFVGDDGEPKLAKETPNRRAATEYAVKTTYTKKGEPVVTKEIKLRDPIAAIAELNKMERIYTESSGGNTYNDNRKTIVIVNSEKAKELTNRILLGERTEDKNN